MKENRAAVHDLAATPVDLASQVVDQEIAVDPVGKRDQRRDHLHAGPHRVDQVRALIQSDVRFKDIVGHHSKPVVPDPRPDVGAEHQGTGGPDQPCGLGVVADTHLHGPPVTAGDIFPDTPFNTFIVTHYPEIR